jgi:hypothetical protein
MMACLHAIICFIFALNMLSCLHARLLACDSAPKRNNIARFPLEKRALLCAETIEAMKAARRGELVTVGSPADLLKESECVRLNTPVALSATIDAKNQGYSARNSTSC